MTLPVHAALISAAGQSRRMGSPKPLLPLGKRSFIQEIAHNFQLAGIAEITVVTGHAAAEVREALQGYPVRFVHNPDYADTDMFYSLRLGLTALPKHCAGVFSTITDAPLFTPFSVLELRKLATERPHTVLIPNYQERSGHPVYLPAAIWPELLQYNGEGGLKGAMQQSALPKWRVGLPDPGVTYYANTPEQYQELLEVAESLRIPTAERCYEIQEYLQVPDKIRRHCQTVTETALMLAYKLHGKGLALNLPLLEAAGLLHDCRKGCPDHGDAGAETLRLLGCPEVASLIETHMDLPTALDGTPYQQEKQLLYLADKLCKEDRLVGLRERFATPCLLPSEEAQQTAAQRLARAKELYAYYCALYGEDLLT